MSDNVDETLDQVANRLEAEDGFPAHALAPNFDEGDEDSQGEGGAFSFHVFTNPLEMEKFFDSQMDQILKGFGFGRGLGE